jgi:membrane-associated protease RseP (regulator of RpoE activity)
MRATRIAAIIVLLVAGMASSVLAQRPVETERPAPGWIGISFGFTGNRLGTVTAAWITEVRPGSPAETAGLQAGDRLLAINDIDSPQELSSLNQLLRLNPGDRVSVEIRRDGRRHMIRLRAAARPEFVEAAPLELAFESDSMVETWVRAMDSLRIRLVLSRDQNESSVRVRTAVETRVTVVTGNRIGVRAPFEFFVFRGEQHDSLRQEMVELNRVMADLEVSLRLRTRELRRTLGTRSDVRFVQEDNEFRRLRGALDEAATRSAGLETAMADDARATAGPEYAILAPGAPVVPSSFSSREAPRSEEFRPLTPYLLGRNRVAGAEVVELRPELAKYFKVEGGVLVVDVTRGTPAAIAGIVPGDVITRMDQVLVRSVADLRFGVSQAGDTLPISLVRQGTSIQVLLRF